MNRLNNIKTMYWLSNLQIYIDPLIKNHDRAFFSRCEQIASEEKFLIKTEISEVKASKLPNVFILFNELGDSTSNLNFEKDFIIQYKQPNLDLFSSSESIESSFEVDSTIELDEVWNFAIESLSSSVRTVEQVYVEASQVFLKTLSSKKHLLKIQESEIKVLLNQFEEKLYSLHEISEVIEYIKEFFIKELNMNGGLITAGELISLNERFQYLPIKFLENHSLFLFWDGLFDDALVVFSVLNDYFSNHQLLTETQVSSQNWRGIINYIPVPIVLIDEQGQLLTHNNAFSNLNLSIKKCNLLVNSEQLKINNNLYRVVINENTERSSVYLFFPINEFLSGGSSPSSEELGIVSSSIAHELNNPLGGILAAIDVLGLDDLSEDTTQSLAEMKKGVLRCKKLVDTFLGFSRGERRHQDFGTNEYNLKNSLSQAHELIRFRLIENNISINLTYEKKQNFIHILNPHTVSMMLYLILGEVLTRFSHYNLVKRSSGLKIDLLCMETENKINIKLPEGIFLSNEFMETKLFSHLLEIEQLFIEVNDDIISIIHSIKN